MMNTYQDEERQLFEASSNSRSFMNPKVVGGLALVLAASATAGAFAGSSSSGVGKLSTSLVREDPIPDYGSYDKDTCTPEESIDFDMACICDVLTRVSTKRWPWSAEVERAVNQQKVSCRCIDDEIVIKAGALKTARSEFESLFDEVAFETERIENHHKKMAEEHATAVAFDDAAAAAHADSKSSLESDIQSIKDGINDLMDKLEADPFNRDTLSDYKYRVDQYYLKTGELAELLKNEPQETAGELQTLSQLKATMEHSLDSLCTDGRTKLAAWKLAADEMEKANGTFGDYCREETLLHKMEGDFEGLNDWKTHERSAEAIIAEDIDTSDPTESIRAQEMLSFCNGHGV